MTLRKESVQIPDLYRSSQQMGSGYDIALAVVEIQRGRDLKIDLP